ncbi:hypothetical protein RFI_09442, partial [Reticulomyxa filosa]
GLAGAVDKPLSSDEDGEDNRTEAERLHMDLSRMKIKHYGYRQLLEHFKNDRIHLWEQIEELVEINSQLSHNIQEMTEQTRDANLQQQELLDKEKELHQHQVIIDNNAKEMSTLSAQVERQAQAYQTLEQQMCRLHNDIHSYVDDVKWYYAHLLSVMTDSYTRVCQALTQSHSNHLATTSDSDHPLSSSSSSSSSSFFPLSSQSQQWQAKSVQDKRSSMEWILKYVEDSETLPMFDCVYEKHDWGHNLKVQSLPNRGATSHHIAGHYSHHREFVLPPIIHQFQQLLQQLLHQVVSTKAKSTKSHTTEDKPLFPFQPISTPMQQLLQK